MPQDRRCLGDAISEERQRDPDEILVARDAEADHGDRKGPFDTTRLNNEERDQLLLKGSDVFYLALRSAVHDIGDMSNLHLEGANIAQARLGGVPHRRALGEGLPG
jgi:hypothetical protein